MNNRQKWQVGIGTLFVILLVLWLFMPGWGSSKIVSIVAALLMIASMAISYFAEEKRKDSK